MKFTTLPQEEAYVFSKSGLTDLENLKKLVDEDCRTNQIFFKYINCTYCTESN